MANQVGANRKLLNRLSIRLGWPFLFIIVVMSGVVGYMVWRSYQFQIQSAQERQRQASALASFQVASNVRQFRSQLDDAARGLVYFMADPAQQVAWLGQAQLAHRQFHDLAVTDVTGQEMARKIWLVPEYLTPLRMRAGAPAVDTALGGEFYLGRVYISDQYQAPFVQMAVPIYTASGAVTGALVAEVDLSQLWVVIKEVQAGQAGLVYMVDEEGRLIAYRESELVQGPLAQLPRVAVVPVVRDYMLRHAESVEIGAQPSGLLCMLRKQCEPVLAYHRPIEETGWGVIVEQPTRVAYAEANALLVLAVVLVALALAILILLGGYIRRGVLQPIHLLSQGAAALAGGRLAQRIQIDTGDEIEALAREFNTMAASLQRSQEQLEEYARTLEQRVAERTIELERRAVQLETSNRVGQQVTSLLDVDELLRQVVHLILAQFGYYFVGVWLLGDKKEFVMLRAGAGQHQGDARRFPAEGEPNLRISMDTVSVIVGVCKSGVERMVDDVSNAIDYMALEAMPATRSEIVLPLRIGDKIIGALDIQSDRAAAFGPDDKLLLQTLANQIAITLRNAQLYEAEQRRRRLAESLERAGRELSSSLDLRQVTGRILEQLASVVPYERSSVMLAYGNVMRIVGQYGFPEGERAMELQVTIRAGDVFEQVVAADGPVLIDDVTKVSGWQQVEWLPLNLSWMGLPLIAQDRAIGMISLTRKDAGAFSAEDATLASAFAGQAAVALENARLYDELNDAYQVLERLDKTKSDFIDVAAHELRTPLTVIRGYAQVMEMEPALKDWANMSELVKGILAGADRLHAIVNSMLDVTKLDSQTLHLRKAPTSISSLVERVRTQFTAALQERKLTLTTAGLDSLPEVAGDPELLFKVFYHLIVNAIKYTPDGGAITVSGKAIEPREAGDPAQAWAQVVVSDTGIGIDPANHELIFEKFYQTGEVAVHSSGLTKFKGGGPGLGLAIARGVVLAHGGKLWVESEGYDEQRCPGSHFHVRLPVR